LEIANRPDVHKVKSKKEKGKNHRFFCFFPFYFFLGAMQLVNVPPCRTRTLPEPDKVERLTQAYGREIFARLDQRGPVLFSPDWFDQQMMEWSMADEAVKVQFFRFIDVLPQLSTPKAICQHLREYFGQTDGHLPPWAAVGARWLPRNGMLANLLAGAARSNARRMARRFIAGANVDEALETIVAMRKRNLAFTVDLLGEATITEAEAEQYQERYVELLEGLCPHINSLPEAGQIDFDQNGPLPRVNVSIKLSALYSQFDPLDQVGTSQAVRDRLRPLLRLAREYGAFINVDMEQHAFKDITLTIFRDILDEYEFRDWPDAGIAIQAYLKSCRDDLQGLARWVQQRGTPIWVRLIKGAYWDYETVISAQQGWPVPVFTAKHETDANYEAMTRFVLENSHLLKPAFGSHNVRSVAYALAYAESLGLPPRSYEIQMLYGMADPIKHALVNMGKRVRVYTPVGQLLPGMAYLVRRLLENTANESFLRASFTEHVSEEQLLMNPQNALVDSARWTADGKKENLSSPSTNHQPLSTFLNEPVADFSRQDAREAMQAALRDVKGLFGKSYPLVIDGRTIETSEWIESVNPSMFGEVVGRCGKATAKQAEEAVVAASAAFAGWRDTDPSERADCLVRAAAVMRRRRWELVAWEVYECGKQWREADADIAEGIDFCEYYAQQMRELAKPRQVHLPGEENDNLYEPRGVAVVIAPWNFPLAILCGMTSAALVTGNTVVMKPAEQSSVVAAKLMEVFQEAGAPPGVLHYLPGIGEEVGPVLIGHPDLALIAFTGSKGVGLLINREAANQAEAQDHVKRVISEMGGKNAIIVDDDADLDEAVHGVAHSAFGYQGQKCSACSRAIVIGAAYEPFLARLVEATKSLKIARAEDPGSTVGPVIDADARQRILSYIAKGKQESRLAYAGDLGSLEGQGYFVAPHIFAEVPPTATIAQEEIFGPVLAILRAENMDEALRIANGVPYALTGGLFSRSPDNIRRVRREFRVGNLYINRKITGALVHRQPFGGFKLSGTGTKAGGPDYLLQFMVPRTITENTMRRGFAPQAASGLAKD
jgi:RHH-type proline utilization regulon transcriptional repressor/proline dehydrogenase/delta 1-pyrroline-5-carboxylate dehydrogenase